MGAAVKASGLRSLLAIGTGVGIEIGAEDLRVTVARVRPSGTFVTAAVVISRFRERPAGEWGAEYNAFLKRAGAGHVTATVLLPRHEVILRQISLPGVPDRDLGAAVGFQIESLHPYAEEDAAFAWARVPGSSTVLIGITRKEVIAGYVTLFAEAGLKASSFTFSAAVLHSAIRLISVPAAGGFLLAFENEGGLEVYGESEARPLFSARFETGHSRAQLLAAAELRLPEEVEPLTPGELLPKPKNSPANYDLSENALAYAAALAGACPRRALALNLLPPENRSSSSRAIFIPTAVLGALLVLAALTLALLSPVEDRRYLAELQAEIAKLQPAAVKSGELDRSIEAARARIHLLDQFRLRSKADLDTLHELTQLLAPPSWLNQVEINRETVILSGETEQAATLLKVLDESPFFRNSEFAMPISRAGKSETFRIRTVREGVPQ